VTEEDWLASTDPMPMLEFLRGKASDRKLWLFSVACCRRVWHLFADTRCRAAVETGERYADGLATDDDLMETSEEAFCRRNDIIGGSLEEAAAMASAFAVVDGSRADNMRGTPPVEAAGYASEDVIELLARAAAAGPEGSPQRAAAEGRKAHAALLRDIFNPFYAVAIADPVWLACNGAAVRKLAAAIYDERAFDRLPLLADALEDAGCADAAVLGHCRSGGEHARGCWAVDLLLAKC
jgi:hypothetical protein